MQQVDQSFVLMVTPATGADKLLLPASKLAALKSSQSGPQWQSLKSRLDANLPKIVSLAAYQGSHLTWIADYALGWLVTGNAAYADKAIAIILDALHNFQKLGFGTRQFAWRGDGVKKTLTLPADVIPASIKVYVDDLNQRTIVRGATATDAADYYSKFLKASNTPDGPPDYVEGIDWRHNPDLANNLIEWIGSRPLKGATYYLTEASNYEAQPKAFTLSGNVATLAVTPTINQVVFVEYIYGNYQQTEAGDGGFNSITIDTSYTSRYLGKYLAIGCDWLAGYPGFEAIRPEVAAMLVRWSDYVRDFGYFKDSPASNYGAGGYVSRVLTALALADSRLISEVKAWRTANLVPVLTSIGGGLAGGFWSEGWDYGAGSAAGILLAGLALEQAGVVTATEERDWSADLMRGIVATSPTASIAYNAGDSSYYPEPWPGKSLFYMIASATTDAQARGYANHVIQDFTGAQSADYVDLLYRDAAAAKADWVNVEPLQQRAIGTGLVTARRDWSNASTWVAFQLGNLAAADHQTYAPGQLQIQRGADDLLVNATGVLNLQTGVYKSTYANSVVIDDNGEGLQNYRFAMGTFYGLPGCVMTAYSVGTDYVYAAGDYHAAYSKKGLEGKGGSCTKLTRQVVYLRSLDTIIVHDRIGTVKAEYPKLIQWHTLNGPTTNGNTWTATAGSSKLTAQSFSLTPLVTTVTPVSNVVNGVNRTVYGIHTTNGAPTLGYDCTTVLQAASVQASPLVADWSTTADGTATVKIGKTVTFGNDGIFGSVN